jgi:hypothetical protein
MKATIVKIGSAALYLLAFMGAFEYRPSAPAGLFPYAQAVMDETAPGQYIPGTYSPFAPAASIASSVSRPYSIKELAAKQISIVIPIKPAGLSAAWDSFGTGGYMENKITGAAGISFGPFSAGAGFSYYNLKIQGGEIDTSENMFDVSAGLLVRPFDWIEAGAAAENIRSFFHADDFYIGESWNAGIRLKPFRGLSMIYNLGKDYSGYINTVSVTAHILPFLSASCGYSRETMTWSGALSVLFKKISASYGIRRHPYLGTTHTIGFSLNNGDGHLPSIKYSANNEEKEEIKKIDINTCSNDEITAIPGINEIHATRIIRYREQIGAITEKALMQLGLSGKEIVRLQRYIYGLADESENENTKKPAPVKPKKKAGKNLFMALVEEIGLSPSQAMELCDAASKEGRAGFGKKIQSMPLNAETKKQAEAVCARYW